MSDQQQKWQELVADCGYCNRGLYQGATCPYCGLDLERWLAGKARANHAALVEAAWKVIVAHQTGHETPEQAEKVWAEEKSSLLNLQTALENLTNDQEARDE